MNFVQALLYGAGVGAGVALVSVIVDEVRGYRRMKRFAAQAQERRRRGTIFEK